MGKDRAAGSNTRGNKPAEDNAVVSAGGTSRGSRVAFALALSALLLGTFVSFGGLTYAATQTKNAVHTAKNVAAGRKVVVHHSSAADQYHKSKPGERQTFTPPSGPSAGGSSPGSSGPIEAQGTLPFTGLSLAGTALASGLLLLLGIVLRRRERRSL
jgi:hypothetical protein